MNRAFGCINTEIKDRFDLCEVDEKGNILILKKNLTAKELSDKLADIIGIFDGCLIGNPDQIAELSEKRKAAANQAK